MIVTDRNEEFRTVRREIAGRLRQALAHGTMADVIAIMCALERERAALAWNWVVSEMGEAVRKLGEPTRRGPLLSLGLVV